MTSVYKIHISSIFGTEYIDMFNDLARFIVIQIGIQTMLYSMDSRFSIFSSDFLILLMFISAGVLFYWLVFRKLIEFD